MIAQATGGGAGLDPTSLIQFGILGVILGLAMLGFVSFKPEVDRLVKDKAKVEDQRDALVATYQTETIPALARYNVNVEKMTDQVIPLFGRTAEALERIERVLDRVERKLG